MSVRFAHRSEQNSIPAAAAGVSRELARLDPFSFFVVSGQAFGAERVVVGSTGAYVIHAIDEDVDGRLRRDLVAVRRAARRVRRQAGEAATTTKIHPVLCLRGRQFAPFSKRGVKVIPWSAVVQEVTGRRSTASQHQARRLAAKLGAPTFGQSGTRSA